MEENMQAVGSVLSNLKNMAQDMGNEISKQNKQLDKITSKVLVAFYFFVRKLDFFYFKYLVIQLLFISFVYFFVEKVLFILLLLSLSGRVC
jgi:hypothetical protein